MPGIVPRAKLMDMRSFADAWPDGEFVQQAAARLPWSYTPGLPTRVLLDGCECQPEVWGPA